MAEDDDGHDIPVDEDLEPPESSWTDQLRAQEDELPHPIKLAIFFYGFTEDEEGTDLEPVLQRIGEVAKESGLLFFDWAAVNDIEVDDIPLNSELFKALVERLR